MELVLIGWVLMGILAAIIANAKGRSAGGFGCLGVLLGPIGILAAMLAAPASAVAARERPDRRVACDRCAEMIQPDARVCRFCGQEYEWEAVGRDAGDAAAADDLPPEKRSAWQRWVWNPSGTNRTRP